MLDHLASCRGLFKRYPCLRGNHMYSKRQFLSIARSVALVLAAGVCFSASAAPPSPPSETVSASIILNVTNPQALTNYIQATLT
ncbi:MAG: hypothetical protein KGQ32_11920, partial [Xanthomonadaceae bacterium]|nr:hypothetical protein [Xanthomonadaceae bacterium]